MLIWDGGTIDGDKVTVLLNGKNVLNNYTLTSAKKAFHLALDEGMNTLTIIANNEGSEPPNTANIQLADGEATYNIIAYNNTGQQATVTIQRLTK